MSLEHPGTRPLATGTRAIAVTSLGQHPTWRRECVGALHGPPAAPRRSLGQGRACPRAARRIGHDARCIA